MARGTNITIPEEIDEAIRAEAYRLGCRPGEVLVRWLRATFPEYIRVQLDCDLNHPDSNTVIDATVRSMKTATPPALNEGATNPFLPKSESTPILPPGDSLTEVPGHVRPD
jgi:hypothetical protein